MERQIISKNGKVFCVTAEPYPAEIIKAMKDVGYKVIEEKVDEDMKSTKENKKPQRKG